MTAKFPSHVVGYSEAIVVSFEVKLPPYLAAVVAEIAELDEDRLEKWVECFRMMMKYHWDEQEKALDKSLAEAPETDIAASAQDHVNLREARKEIAQRA